VLLKARTGASILQNGFKTRRAQQAKTQPSQEALRVSGRIVRIRYSGKVAFAAKPTCENLNAKHRQQEATPNWTRCGAGVFKERSVEKQGTENGVRFQVTG
jgi:lysyl-tRNA synthetase class II